MTDFPSFEAERIRLLILIELVAQPGGSWTLSMLERAIRHRGYRKSADYLLTQLRWLDAEVLAVRLMPAESETVVVVRSSGRRHVAGELVLPGIDTPSDEA